jgi:hypothetical protein
MMQLVGVIVLALGLLGVSHSIHEGKTIGRGRTFLVMRVGDLVGAVYRQDQPGVRRARPMRSSPPWRRSAGSRCCSSRGGAFVAGSRAT